MRKIALLFIVAFITNGVNAQVKMSNLFDGTTKVTFLGLDFTQAKFIGQEGFADPDKIKTYYLQRWNEVLVEEFDKYSLMKALKSKNYATETDALILANDGYNVNANIINGSHTGITEKDVEKAVKKYKISKGEGIGVAYVVESFSKTDDKAFIWVTFIDMKSKKVLYTEKLSGKTSGFGFRNYWLGAVSNVHKSVASRYNVWKKKFNS